MKTLTTSSFFVLSVIVASVMVTPSAFADHSEVIIRPVDGAGFIGCQETPEGCSIPNVATVDVGGKVIFENTDSVPHVNVSGEPGEDEIGQVFNSGLVLAGASFEWTPEEVGEVPWFCTVHPWMTGTIIVQEAGAMDDKMMDDKMMDDKMMDDKMMDDKMMMEGDPSATGMLSDGTMVKIWADVPTAGQQSEISVVFDGAEHVNYDISVTQNGASVLNSADAHAMTGSGTHLTALLGTDDPLEIAITTQGYGMSEPYTGPIGETVTFSNVVPEFGTIAMMILAVAVISVIAITAKSRVVPRL